MVCKHAMRIVHRRVYVNIIYKDIRTRFWRRRDDMLWQMWAIGPLCPAYFHLISVFRWKLVRKSVLKLVLLFLVFSLYGLVFFMKSLWQPCVELQCCQFVFFLKPHIFSENIWFFRFAFFLFFFLYSRGVLVKISGLFLVYLFFFTKVPKFYVPEKKKCKKNARLLRDEPQYYVTLFL